MHSTGKSGNKTECTVQGKAGKPEKGKTAQSGPTPRQNFAISSKLKGGERGHQELQWHFCCRILNGTVS